MPRPRRALAWPRAAPPSDSPAKRQLRYAAGVLGSAYVFDFLKRRLCDLPILGPLLEPVLGAAAAAAMAAAAGGSASRRARGAAAVRRSRRAAWLPQQQQAFDAADAAVFHPPLPSDHAAGLLPSALVGGALGAAAVYSIDEGSIWAVRDKLLPRARASLRSAHAELRAEAACMGREQEALVRSLAREGDAATRELSYAAERLAPALGRELQRAGRELEVAARRR
jgi:hypothetical protein